MLWKFNCPRAKGAERRYERKPGVRVPIPPGYLPREKKIISNSKVYQ
jgi:hypothetical protein